LNRILRLASISAASAPAAPKGRKYYSLVRGPRGLRPSTRKDIEMAKSAAKPGSIPSYEEELEKLSAELKAAEQERAHLEAQWRQKYMPDVEELIEFARRRKHPWAQKIGPENEGIVKETFLVWLYRSTQEQRMIRALEHDIEDLKLRIRKAKKMLGLLKGQRN
jgi:DNA repair exonuclease SbcCD ATPase subunit